MRARLIVNPSSGLDRAAAQLVAVNEKLLTLVRDLDITITVAIEDARRAAARAVADRCDALYVAGGDGTLNAVLGGLAREGEPFPRIPIGVVPFGTGNDFARAIGLGEDPDVALDRLLDATVVDVDVGTMNDRPFVNVSAGGFVAEASEMVTEGLKDAAGKLAYFIGGARALLGTEPFSARVIVHQDGGWRGAEGGWSGEVELQMFAVCNARTIGGGRPIAPRALLDDGELDGFLVRRMPLFDFVGVLQQIALGEHEDDERVLRLRGSAFELQFSRPVHVNADGEVLEADRCRYAVHRRAARFFCGPEPCTLAHPMPFGAGVNDKT